MMIMKFHNKLNTIILCISFIFCNYSFSGEVNSWECYKFEGSRIIGDDEEYLGSIGPSWMADSIFNSSSQYSSSWSQSSIFNNNSKYGNSYSSYSAFNDSASSPPKIYKDGELIGFLSVGPRWNHNRYSPYDIKFTCDWD